MTPLLLATPHSLTRLVLLARLPQSPLNVAAFHYGTMNLPRLAWVARFLGCLLLWLVLELRRRRRSECARMPTWPQGGQCLERGV
jgi:hypothetical protein